MNLDSWPTTAEILNVFSQELAAVGGRVSDSYDDGGTLFARSILPELKEVRPGDRLQGGVAVRATEQELCVHPYVFRLVCRNGAISAHATQSRRIERADVTSAPDRSVDDVLMLLRNAVQHCCAGDAFAAAASGMRSAMLQEADMVLNLLPMLSRMPQSISGQLVQQILRNFSSEGDRSRFGLMNAITATARDTRNPELRWQLEELGGAVPALRIPTRRPGGAAAQARRSASPAEMVGSGV